MKKRVFVSAAMAALVFAAASCSRTAPPLEHDAEIAALLAGRWQRELSLETQISTDEANPQRVTGTVASKAITVLTLNEDQTLSLESRQEFISYTPADGTEPLPEEVVERFALGELAQWFHRCGMEALVLGCTHFPYFQEALAKRTELPRFPLRNSLLPPRRRWIAGSVSCGR